MLKINSPNFYITAKNEPLNEREAATTKANAADKTQQQQKRDLYVILETGLKLRLG